MRKETGIDRRTVLTATTALTAASLISSRAFAQTPSAAALPSRGEFVVRGAHVLSMDDAIGDLPSGDVHVRDGAIVAVAANVNAPGATIIDGKGTICMPGFVDTHWHHWTSFLRPEMRADNPKRTYFPVTFGLGVHYTPEDSYYSVRLGLSQAIAAGITTTHNWAHNVRSPAHADAELRAMREMGIRGRFAYGCALGLADDKPMDLADLKRVKGELEKDAMLTLGICSRNVDGSLGGTRGAISPAMAKTEWGGARELGLPITLHTSGLGAIKVLNDAGLLGKDLQLVHPLNTSAEDREALAKNGVSYSTSPVGEARRPGDIQHAEMMQAGVRLSLSIDHTTTYDCDCFNCMRMLYTLNVHRARATKFQITTKRAVQMATIDGAQDLGIADKTGSLTPGKRADMILVRTTDINMTPMGDPYDALVQLAQPGNVDTVIVDGRILRRGGKFTALDQAGILRDATQALAALKTRAKWT
jgi:cytosine/adenosine deaminase-related metal-dependent hydrolase